MFCCLYDLRLFVIFVVDNLTLYCYRVARVVAPKKIALKGAESDLAVAMEVCYHCILQVCE